MLLLLLLLGLYRSSPRFLHPLPPGAVAASCTTTCAVHLSAKRCALHRPEQRCHDRIALRISAVRSPSGDCPLQGRWTTAVCAREIPSASEGRAADSRIGAELRTRIEVRRCVFALCSLKVAANIAYAQVLESVGGGPDPFGSILVLLQEREGGAERGEDCKKLGQRSRREGAPSMC